MSGKKLSATVYMTQRERALLKELSRVTRIPQSEFVREGIDMVLAVEGGATEEAVDDGTTNGRE